MTTIKQNQLVEETLQEYREGNISIGRVGEILNLHIMDVQALLAEGQIPLNITMEDVETDIATLRKLGHLK